MGLRGLPRSPPPHSGTPARRRSDRCLLHLGPAGSTSGAPSWPRGGAEQRSPVAATLSCSDPRVGTGRDGRAVGPQRSRRVPASSVLPCFSRTRASPVLPAPGCSSVLGQGEKRFSVMTFAGGTVYLVGCLLAIHTLNGGKRFAVLLTSSAL